MDTLYAALGQFYFTTHFNSPPTFLQVIGWTKGAEHPDTKRHYVYVRKVPLIHEHSCGRGTWEFDTDLIKRYAATIKTPIHKNVDCIVDGNAIVIDGANFIRFQSITVPQKLFEYARVTVHQPEPVKKFKRLKMRGCAPANDAVRP